MALPMVLMCASLASCSNKDEIIDEPQENRIIQVSLGCTGEILDTEYSPLTRATGNDLYAIQVYSLTENQMDGGEVWYQETTPYAYGVFTSLENLSIGLLEGQKYRFEAMMVVDGNTNGYWFSCGSYSSDKFTFSTSEFIHDIYYNYIPSDTYIYDIFYGKLDNYDPTENGNAEIYMKHVSYGANFIAKDLTEGALEIKVSNNTYSTDYSLQLTAAEPESYGIYTFRNFKQAYMGTEVHTGYDPETGNATYEYQDNYSENKQITVSWTKADGTTIPLGTYSAKFKRNQITTITIKAENLTASNGIKISLESTEMSNGGEYLIEGGKITDVTVSEAA